MATDAVTRDRRYTPIATPAPDPGAYNPTPVNGPGGPGVYDWQFGANPTINPDLTFTRPTYSGSDTGYAAWLATADQQANDAISQARARRAQLNDAYRQALTDLDRSAVQGRRNIQTGMLQRGMFRSGEFDRRGQEYDNLIDQTQKRANSTLVQQIGDVDIGQQNTMSRLASDAANQYSAAMQRDALAAYQASQAATAATPAPAAVYTPPPQAAAPAAAPRASAPAAPRQQAGIDPRYRVPAAPKASGSTGQLAQRPRGSLQ